MTPEDVTWSLTTLRETHPQYSAYYKNVTKAEQTGEHEVTFVFSEKGNRELPQIVSQIPVLPKHWWTGNGRIRQAAGHHRHHARNSAGLRPPPVRRASNRASRSR